MAINHSLASATLKPRNEDKTTHNTRDFWITFRRWQFSLYAKHNELWNRTHNSFAPCISLSLRVLLLSCFNWISMFFSLYIRINLMKSVEIIKSNEKKTNTNQEITISNSSYYLKIFHQIDAFLSDSIAHENWSIFVHSMQLLLILCLWNSLSSIAFKILMATHFLAQ